jgi:hypothetical protein
MAVGGKRKRIQGNLREAIIIIIVIITIINRKQMCILEDWPRIGKEYVVYILVL